MLKNTTYKTDWKCARGDASNQVMHSQSSRRLSRGVAVTGDVAETGK